MSGYIAGIYGDMAAESRRQYDAMVDARNQRKSDEEYDRKLFLQYKKLDSNLAFTIAIRVALEVAFKAAITDANGKRPAIPILDDQDFRGKVGEAGRTAFYLAEETSSGEIGFDAARVVGRTFRQEPLPDLFKNHVPVDLFNERTALCNERNTEIKKLSDELSECKRQLAMHKKTEKENHEVIEDLMSAAKQAQSAVFIASSEKDLLLKDNLSLTKACAQHMAQSSAFRAQLSEADPSNPLLVDSSLRQRVADVAYAQLAATDFKDWSVVREVGSTFVSTRERNRS